MAHDNSISRFGGYCPPKDGHHDRLDDDSSAIGVIAERSRNRVLLRTAIEIGEHNGNRRELIADEFADLDCRGGAVQEGALCCTHTSTRSNIDFCKRLAAAGEMCVDFCTRLTAPGGTWGDVRWILYTVRG